LIASQALYALYDNVECAENTPELKSKLAVDVDRAIRAVKKADFRGNPMKEREVRNAIAETLGSDDMEYVSRIFEIVKSQREY
jgi:type I restriction enzyme, R subunit